MFHSKTLPSLCCAFVLAITGCDTSLSPENPYDPDVPVHQRDPGTLSGTVVLELGTDPTAAVIRVQPAGRSAIPDDTGRFEITGLAPGSYEVQVQAPRHTTWRQAGVYLDTGAKINLGTLRLEAARGSLTGGVVLEKLPGVPLDEAGGVLIYAQPFEEGRLAAGDTGKSTTSNPDGSWSLDDLVAGTYVVSGNHPDFIQSDALQVEVTEDGLATVEDLVLRSITGLVEINTGAAYTNHAAVTLRVLAFEADEMKVSEQPDLSDATWRRFEVELPWTLSGDDGDKTLYARFRNAQGTITPIVHDGIVLDREAPVNATVDIAPEDDDEYVLDPQVAVAFDARDDLSGVAQMRVALDGDVSDEPWGDFERQRVMELPVGADPDGVSATVIAQFRDGAGNESAPVEDDTIVDTVAPLTPAVVIAGGAARTASVSVTLTLTAERATRMQVGNDSGLADADWLPYAPSLGWVLTAGDEQKAVYARYRDDAGNETAIVQDGIELNTRGAVEGRFTLEGLGTGEHADIIVEITTDPVSTTQTAADGSFVFADLPVGAYTLLASKDGFRSLLVDYVPIDPGETTALSPRELPVATGTLIGSARRAGGDAGGHGGILIEVVDTGRSTFTAPDGAWTVPDVPVGQYTIRATAEAHHEATATDVSVLADDTVTVAELVLAANPGTVFGAVEIEGRSAPDLGGVAILVGGQAGLTGTDGAFEITDVPVGSHALSASLDGYSPAQALVVVEPGVRTDAGIIGLFIARGAIEGAATLAGGADHSGITVELDNTGYAGVTGAGGQYRIESVPVGAYTLTARKEGYVSVAVGGVTVEENVTVTARSVELVRQRGDFTIEERVSGDQEYLNDPQVKLSFTEVPQDAATIWIAEDAAFSTGGWAAFVGTEHDYDLLGSDGTISVFVKFKDTLEQESPVFTASTVLDTEPPLDTSSVEINGGAEWAVDGDVSLALVAQDATSGVDRVRIAVDGAIDGEPDQAFSATIAPVRLDQATVEGVKIVLVEFVDRAGNVSAAPATDEIYLDLQAPTAASLTINDPGDSFTTEAVVTLHLSAEDACTAGYPAGNCVADVAQPAQMLISNHSGFPGAMWEAYATERAWFLTPGDDDKTVHAKFRDGAGHETDAVFASITLDRTPPGSPRVTVQDGEEINSPDVTLALSATGGPVEMNVAEGGDFLEANWEPYDENPYAFTLSANDGLKTVTAKFRDAAGNQSVTASDTAMLDQQAPGGSVSIVEGEFVAAAGVTLSLNAPTDVTRLCVYGDVTSACTPGDLGTWVGFSATRSITLSAGDGPKTVRVLFRDAAGNQSVELTAAITLDVAPPTDLALTITGDGPAGTTRSAGVTLAIAATDTASGLAEMMLANDAAYTDAEWQSFSSGTAWTLTGNDGDKRVYVKVRDRAGNTAETSAQITLDRAVPTVDLLQINDGAAYTPSTLVSVDLQGTDNLTADGDLAWCLANNPTFDGADCGTGLDLVDRNFTLPGGDGEKIVYARIVDEAGHVVEASVSIVLDAEAPTGGSLLIDEGDFTTSPDINLTLGAAGAVKMCLYGDIADPCVEAVDDDWIDFDTTAQVSLAGSDGAKTVRVKFRDGAKNVTGEAWDTVTLDRAKPTGVSLNVSGEGPDGFTRAAAVMLQIAASDTTSGVTEMMVSESPVFAGASWEGFATLRGFTLSDLDEGKTVYVRVRDRAGNTEDSSDTVVLDREAPGFNAALALTGNNGEPAGFSHDSAVTAGFQASDNVDTAGQLDYWLANDPSFAGATRTDLPGTGIVSTVWTLASGQGSRTVYLRVTDRAGNLSDGSAAIVVDGEGPAGASASITENASDEQPGNGYTQYTAITLHTAAVGAAQVCVTGPYSGAPADCNEASGGWGAYTASRAVTLSGGNGTKTLNAYFRDDAHNVSGPHPAAVVLDTAPPTSCTVAITGTSYDLSDQPQDDSGLTALSDVSLRIGSADATSPVSQIRLANDAGFPGADWRSFTGDPMPVDSWLLAAGAVDDEARDVFLECRDAADNVASGSDSIDLDNVAPTSATVLIENGDEYTRIRTNRDLALSASGATHAKYSTSAGFSGASWDASPWSGVTISLTSGDGVKTVYAKFRDSAGNQSAVATDTIILDTSDPRINGFFVDGCNNFKDTEFCAEPFLSLRIDAIDCDEICLFTDTRCDSEIWEPYAFFKSYTITGADGDYALEVACRDRALNTDQAGPVDIRLDTTLPEAPVITTPSQKVNRGSLTVNRSSDSTIDENFQNWECKGGSSWATWTECSTSQSDTTFPFNLSANRENVLQVRSTDFALNTSDPGWVTIVEDSSAPGAPTITEVTNRDNAVTLKWSPSTALDVAGYRLYYDYDYSGSDRAQYTGTYANEGDSPIDVGNLNNFTLTGLSNGILFYIAMEAYDDTVDPGPNASALTPSVEARPNRLSPEVESIISTGLGGPISMTVENEYVYVAKGNDEVRCYDCSNPSACVSCGWPANNWNTAQDGEIVRWGRYTFVTDDWEYGVRAFRASPQDDYIWNADETTRRFNSFHPQGQYAFGAYWLNPGGWRIGRFTFNAHNDPYITMQEEVAPAATIPNDIWAEGNRLYMVTNNGLYRYNTANNLAGTVTTLSDEYGGTRVKAYRNMVFVGSGSRFLYFTSYGSSLQGGAFVGCQDFEVGGNYVYCVGSDGLHVLDISTPDSVDVVGEYREQGFSQVKLSGGYVYALSADQVYVFQVANADHVGFTSGVVYDTRSNRADGPLVVIGGASGSDYRARLIDVSDPNDLNQIDSYTNTTNNTNVNQIAFESDYAYINHVGPEILILDFGYTSGSLLGTIVPGDTPSGMYAYGNYFINIEYNTGIRSWDVRDRSNPAAVDTLALAGWRTWYMYASGGLAHVACDDPGNSAYYYQIVDVSYPPTMISRAAVNMNPLVPKSIWANGDYAYVCLSSDGFRVFDISTVTSPTEVVGAARTGFDANLCTGSGHYLFTGDEFRVWDVSDPTNPTLILEHEPLDWVMGISQMGPNLYITGSMQGLDLWELKR